MKELLNAAQYRSISIVLRMLEERLHQAEVWLQGAGEEAGLLYHRTLISPPERRALVQQQIAEALQLIATLQQTFQLEAEEDDLRRTIRAALSASWADLCDARSATLRRYGEVHPELAAVLDPAIERLAHLALAIAETV